jgi:peptidoglycan/xylan/chitin deacetylase (PgdA/CDA1 family)
MMRLEDFRPALAAALIVALAGAASASKLIEPRLKLPAESGGSPRVALTLDACSGKVDGRILDTLIANHIPATIFATARWLKRNSAAMAEINAHPDLIEVENHGARHLPAVDEPRLVYGIPAAGSPDAVRAEVMGGGQAVAAAIGHRPTWFRGATGKYTPSSEALIRDMHYRIAGYSLIADDGARLGTAATARRIEAAHDGDVIIAHVNQPARPAGEGVVEGVLALKARGFRFVRLEDAFPAHPSQVAQGPASN